MPDTYKLREGSLQEQFAELRTKVQFYGGGFANGKTSAACVLKALKLAKDYPGCNGLIARSTYPKLNDTIRKEFLKWCPTHWIKSFPKSANGTNTCTLINGSVINFRYVAQQGTSSGEASTSNLLSATYDWAIIDQIEDPEIVEKDFDDILGRLRGMTTYRGDDPTMPATGPRWFIITANPTRNWVYKRIIKPYHDFTQHGKIADNLLVYRDPETDEPYLDENGNAELMLGVVEGSTYENAENLTPDFIRTLESTYRGAMKERFLMGGWGSYEGLIYSEYSEYTHELPKNVIINYLEDLQRTGYELTFVDGYDFGLAVPSCYILSVCDPWGNMFLIDGFYKAGEVFYTEDQSAKIMSIRNEYGVPQGLHMMADPSIFRRTNSNKRTIGKTTASTLYNNGRGPMAQRGNNDILNGIMKVISYVAVDPTHKHPITGKLGAPRLYVCDDLTWIGEEFTSYMWKKTPKGDQEDAPRDVNDHAMDTIKYMLSNRPEIVGLPKVVQPTVRAAMDWQELDTPQHNRKSHRYG